MQGRGFNIHRVPDATQARGQPRRRATSFSLPVLCPMHKRIASRVCHTFSSPGCPRQARICSSTRSAVRRSASSRRAIRLPLRKNVQWRAPPARQYRLCLLSAAGADRPGASPPALRRRRHRKRIGHGFPYLNSGDAADHIIQTFQMLNVDGCENINASFQQFFDILPAFRMTRT